MPTLIICLRILFYENYKHSVLKFCWGHNTAYGFLVDFNKNKFNKKNKRILLFESSYLLKNN